MCKLMDVAYSDSNYNVEEIIKKVMTNMWKYSQTYSIGRFFYCLASNFF